MNNRYLLFASKAYSFSILRPLQAAIRRREDHVAWFLYELDLSNLNEDEQCLFTVDEVRQFDPGAVFVPGNWVPDFFPGVKVEIFHGFGIDKKGHFNIRGLFDLYCTHGPLTTKPFQALKKKHSFFEVVETGWPKTDTLFSYKTVSTWKENKRIGKPVILYAPTFSPALTSAFHLRKTISKIAQKGTYLWLIKFHPKMDPDVVRSYRQLDMANINIIDESDVIPYLHAADVLVSDTSSVVAEFLLLKKPVVTFRAKSPEAHLLNITKPDDLESALAAVIQNPGKFLESTIKFVSMMHPYMDGRSSERVLDATDRFVAQKAHQMPPKPLNLWRKLQARSRLKYYHLR
ncbi:MAG: CDP-glycerol glycerophosphotransferase family protein [Desulfobacterales bacterium]